MIRILATTAIAATCASAALLTTASAAPRADTWFECIDGWQKNQCVKSGVTFKRERAARLVIRRPPPPPRPEPEVPRYEIHPEGNGSVSGGGGGAGGGGGGGGR